jgi:hypothetical protein
LIPSLFLSIEQHREFSMLNYPHKITPLILCMTLLLSAYAQSNSSSWVAQGADLDCRGLTCSSDGKKIAAAILGGAILRSSDGGSSWQSTGSGNGQWSCIAGNSTGSVLVSAERDYGRAIISRDGGSTWTTISAVGNGNWTAATSSSNGSVLALAYSGSNLSISTDSGVTWNQRGESTYWSCLASSADGKTLVAGAASSYSGGGSLYISTDSGTNWSALDGAGLRAWKSVTISADGSHIAAAVMRGKIYLGTKSGSTWTWSERLNAAQWTSITSSADGSKLAAANSGGKIQVSNDGGTTWNEQGDTDNWAAITSNQDGSKLISGVWNGKIHTSNQSSSSSTGTSTSAIPTSWSEAHSGTDWKSLSCAADGTSIVAITAIFRASSAIATSNNAGAVLAQNNSKPYSTSPSATIWTASAISRDGKSAVACCAGAGVWLGKRPDTNSAWVWTQVPDSKLNSTSALNWSGVSINQDGKTIVALQGSASIYISTDSGNSWTKRDPIAGYSQAWLCAACSDDGKTIVAGTSNGSGSLYLSKDSGATWDYTSLSNVGNRSWRSLAMNADGTIIIAGSGSNNVYIGNGTTGSWTWKTCLDQGNWLVSSSSDASRIIAASPNGKVQISFDGGNNWTATGEPRNWASVATDPTGTHFYAGTVTMTAPNSADIKGALYISQ